MGGFAWVTLATNDSYSLGALVLAHSLRRVGSKHDLAVLVTPGVTQAMREKLTAIFTLVQEVNVLDSRDEANLALLARPELGITFTKLHCWRLTQYERCVFVDADTLVVRNCDELFEREELSAAPDVGWPDCFNSGVFVFTPSQQTFASLTAFAASQGSFDGGDQGLLNSYFSDWAHKDISKHLPFIYNMCSTATYSYLPAYKQFGEDVRIIHFIGSTKPWLHYFDSVTGQVQSAPGCNHLQPLLQLWWNIFCANVHPELSPVMASTTLAPHWHDILLPMTPIPINTRHHVVHDSTDRTTDEIDAFEPDFSEFRDPWDDYASGKKLNHIRDHWEMNVEQITTHHQPFISSDQSCETLSPSHHHDHIHSVASQVHIDEHPAQNFDSCPVEDITSSHTQYYEPHNHSAIETRHLEHHNQHIHPPSPIDSHGHPSHIRTHHEEHRHHENLSHSPIHDHCIQSNQNHPSFSNIAFQSNKPQTQTHHHSNQDSRHHEIQCHEDAQHRLTDIPHECEYVNQHSSSTDSYQSSSSHHTPDRPTGDVNDNNVASIDASTPQFQSQPCTVSTTTTTHTEIYTGDVETNDSGIAGALGKLTLGETRSPEQVALEEHMRKYSWEQGQIDYMGRDSFDNIWKKICTTLDAAPAPEEPTTPKEKTPPLEKETSPSLPEIEAATPVEEAASAGEVPPQTSDLLSEHQSEKSPQEVAGQSCEVPTPVTPAEETKEAPTPTTEQSPGLAPQSEKPADAPTPLSPRLSLTSTPPILSLTSSPPILSIKEAGEKTQALAAKRKLQEPEKRSETVIPLGYTSPTTFESTTSLDLSTAGKPQDPQEVIESPVPIQVAESVLEADIKESVSEHIKPETEEAISSISAPTQESVSAVVETLEPAVPVQAPPPLEAVPSPLNGTGGFDSDIKSDDDVPRTPTGAAVAETPAPLEASELSQPEVPASAESAVQESPAVLEQVQQAGTVPEAAEQIEMVPQQPQSDTILETAGQIEKVPEPTGQADAVSEAARVETSQPPGPIAPEPIEVPTSVKAPSQPLAEPAPPTETSKSSAEPAIEPEQASKEPELPKQLSEATKDLPIPGTPTIIEATPPTSPQFELAEGEETKAPKKTVKKVMKKTSSDEKTESSEADEVKKPKKVVKKVVKKAKEGDEGAEGSSSGEKPKKVVKVVKKTKETLQTDSSVPETPPPTDAPVPPKRKVKPGTTKATAKKPDTEQ